MPPSPAYSETVRATVLFTLPNTDIAENVLHFSVGAGAVVDDAFATDLADQIFNAYTAELPGVQTNQMTLARITIQDLRSTPYPTFPRPYAGAGSENSTPMPMQMSIVMSLHTTHAGRSGRGRVYLPGFCESSNVGLGVILASTVETVIDLGEALATISSANAEDVGFGVLSRKNGVTYAVTTVTADDRWDVQRRRANRRLG